MHLNLSVVYSLTVATHNLVIRSNILSILFVISTPVDGLGRPFRGYGFYPSLILT